MRYTNYVILNAAISIIFFVIFSVVFLSLLGWVGLWLVVLFGFVFLVGFAMSVAWAHRAVTEFHGSPFPGIWGVLGSNIEPDDNSPEPRFLSSGRSMWDSPEVRKAEAPVEPATASLAAPQANGVELGGSPAYGCKQCGAVTQGADSKFCRKCGAPLVT